MSADRTTDLGRSVARPHWDIRAGDCRDLLREMEPGSVQTCVTSPPYFGLRDYGTGKWIGGDPACSHTRLNPRQDHSQGSYLDTRDQPASLAAASPMRTACYRCGAQRADRQIGLEATPQQFVDQIVSVFQAVRRVLAEDGTLWLNLGDSYAGSWGAQSAPKEGLSSQQIAAHPKRTNTGSIPAGADYKAKDLYGIPWMVAFALRADGWYLRADVVWHKPNPMPESIKDRPTRSHEFIFLLSKSPRYYYDHEAIKEPDSGHAQGNTFADRRDHRISGGLATGGTAEPWSPGGGRNKRDVWTVATRPFPGAHFATFPAELIEPCILAGAGPGATVLDPFAGAGTTGLVALRQHRSFVGIELNPEYAELARQRIRDDAPLLNTMAEVAA